MPYPVALYPDGGPGVGLGHITRSLGLAHGLEESGFKPLFIVTAESELEGFLKDRNRQPIVSEPDAGEIARICRQLDVTCLVIDNYRVNAREMEAFEEQGLSVICFEDKSDRELPVSMVVNGAPGAAELEYATRTGTIKLLGTQYQIVRPEFLAEVQRDYQAPVRNILVTVGGDDLIGAFAEVLPFFRDRFTQAYPACSVHFVVGPFFKTGELALGERCFVHEAPKDMRALMVQADVAISAGGQTLYELARCGTPTIGFCVGKDQLLNLASMEKSTCIRYIGWAKSEAWLEKLWHALSELMDNKILRQELGTNAARLIDGKGAIRIAKEIKTLMQSQ